MVSPLLKSYTGHFKRQVFKLVSRGKTIVAPENSVHALSDDDIPGAVVLGAYYQGEENDIKLTKTGQLLNDIVDGNIYSLLKRAAPFPQVGDARVFHGLHPTFSPIAVVGLGDDCQSYDVNEQLDERKESVRIAAAVGVKACQEFDIPRILVDSLDHAESAAEGAFMAAWMYQDFREERKRKKSPRVDLFDALDLNGWQIGLHKAAAQNLTRHLQEVPSNQMTPKLFARSTTELLSNYCINVKVRLRHWAKLRNLNAFLAAGSGGCDSMFLEIFYEGCNPDICPIILIGKGVTFNSVGVCGKSCKELRHMRGDMLGAACIVATIRAMAALEVPVNVRGLIPLCANTPGARAVKPGDTIKAYNGMTIRVDSTQCDGLLMLADMLSYAGEYNPKCIVNLGSLADSSFSVMGQSASLVFSNDDCLYEMMRNASIHTGDRIWRFPLWEHFDQNVLSLSSDLKNTSHLTSGGGPCKAAAFLRNFVPPNTNWMYVDTHNVFKTDGIEFPYLRTGMSGRPTRNIIELLAHMACKNVL